MGESQRTRKTYECLFCKKQFEDLIKRNRRYCSKNCKYQSARTDEGTRKLGRKEYQRRYLLKKYYGLTHNEYDKLLENQNYCCALCKIQFLLKDKICVDHVKGTKVIRGIIHNNCNLFIGFANHDSQKLLRGVEYLTGSNLVSDPSSSPTASDLSLAIVTE